MDFDLIVIGSGPGGYVAAIRATQLGMKVAIVEKESLGGICLNWGCIPTKALIKSAQVYDYIKSCDTYGIKIKDNSIEPNFSDIISRSRKVADKMNKGVKYLMSKNNIKVINGTANLIKNKGILVGDKKYSANNILIATGARSMNLPNIAQDGKKIVGYREAMTLKNKPKRLAIVGAGAIGCEFAYFYNSLSTEVHLIEFQDEIIPMEDKEVSNALKTTFKKKGINVMTSSSVESINKDKNPILTIKSKDEVKSLEVDVVIMATGIKSNIENLGLEGLGISISNDKITVDSYYQTNISGYYAIGDVIKGPALAHVASTEGIICVEKIANKTTEKLNYGFVPSCIYCCPEVASVGSTEETLKEKGIDIKVGRFPFSASGKANASSKQDGFIKVIFDSKYGEFLGCHMIGENVTEMISEAVVAMKNELTADEIMNSIHPHPTLSECLLEAVHNAYSKDINI